ncbi:MAG: arginine N-succinyltransferase, partial [Pseudomonadota bacterium]
PTMVAMTDRVTSVEASKSATLTLVDIDEGERAILATGQLESFRACYGARRLDGDGGIAIDSAAADTLDVRPGDTVWSVAR